MKILEINKSDLQSNIEKIKERAGETKIIAVVKGNAYGLGLKEFTEILIKNGITDLAVSSVEEAIELSDLKVNANIYCLEATSVKKEIEELLAKNVIITIDKFESAKILNELAISKKKKACVQIKVDTGFSRYGFSYLEKETICKTIKECTSIEFEGVFSHFSYSYSQDEKFTRLQFDRFLEVKNYIEKNDIIIPMYHICNSSAFLRFEDMFLDAVRIGSAFLGRISIENTLDLRKIACLKSNVVDIKEIHKNDFIGYSNSEKASKDMKLAIVPIGYADGFHLSVKNDTFKFIDRLRILKDSLMEIIKPSRIYVKINGRKYKVIGRIGMNHITVDITNSSIKIGDIVELEGSPILVDSKIRREYV